MQKNSASDKTSPMMAQYQRIKSESGEALLFFRLGDFYEMFGDDAVEASRLLEITLTARTSGEGRQVKIPMCGVPYHAAEGYINRLLKLGKKVAIVEQMEDPRKTKGMVRRELVRIITPGTILTAEGLDAKSNNYLCALAASPHGLGLTAADLSTGEFYVTEFSGPRATEECWAELNRFRPSELLVPDDLSPHLLKPFQAASGTYITRREGFRFDPDAGRTQLIDHFGVHSLDGFGCGDYTIGLGAAAATLYYLSETQRGALSHIRKLTSFSVHAHMLLDDASLKNLELIRNLADGSRRNTLWDVLDYTLTAMGGRCLQRWILRPLISLEAIQRRQAAVAEMVGAVRRRQTLAGALDRMHDLERLAGRIGSGTAGPRDLAALGSALGRLPNIKHALAETNSDLLVDLRHRLPECTDLLSRLTHALVDQPPVSPREGGLIRNGFNAEIDELRGLARDGKTTIAELQSRERERTGISSLKVEYNTVFGYYIEVSKANSKLVPADYQRKQTLVNAERYITPELKAYETKVLGAQEKLETLEFELFLELRNEAGSQLSEILLAAEIVAELDAIQSLAEVAARNRYVRPQMTDTDELFIREGRHPVVEQLVKEKFVPNNTRLDHQANQVLIITGPNMAGKSTYLRQTALIVIMAHMGGFVPAVEARIGITDRVFTRVGAADNLSAGQSTFMVEMNETANILHHASVRSLVILDEVGRGTSTFDGVSIAWAVAEYLHDQIGAKTLFATHYYELTELALSKPRVKNLNIAVREWQDEIIFLRKILEGSTDRSYGIQVARLAGLPDQVVSRAREVLANLEKANYTENGSSRLARHESGQDTSDQKNLFSDSLGNAMVQALQTVNPEQLTPLEALNFLAELKKQSQAG